MADMVILYDSIMIGCKTQVANAIFSDLNIYLIIFMFLL